MDEALIKRVPPHSIEAEQSVVGAMLMDRDAITVAAEIICGDDFYQKAYGVIFDSVVELFNEGKPVDLITLQNRLREKAVPEEISSLEFVRDLVTAVPTSANVKYYAEIVSEKATLRRLIKMNEAIADECYQGQEPLEAILERTEKQVFELVQNRGGNGEYVPIKQVVLNALEKIEKASKSKGTVTGIPTGFIDLDYKTSGLQPSDLILVAARPSMGKTAFVLNIAQHVAFKQNRTVAIFSLEMSKEQLVNRLFSLESYVDAQLLRTGNLKDSDWEKLIEGAGTIGRSNLIIDDTPGISISEMRSKCRKYKMEHNLELIIIDYLQLMSGSVGGRNESRQQEISDISRSLKALARELSVPVIALSQLSRAVEQRPDHRPMLSDLRESGAIEQDADVVMFIYRDDYYNKDTEHVNEAEIIIAKQRNGPIGTVTLTWLPQYTKFANSERKVKLLSGAPAADEVNDQAFGNGLLPGVLLPVKENPFPLLLFQIRICRETPPGSGCFPKEFFGETLRAEADKQKEKGCLLYKQKEPDPGGQQLRLSKRQPLVHPIFWPSEVLLCEACPEGAV